EAVGIIAGRPPARAGDRPVLTRQHRQEALSRAYVQAVAAQAGMNLTLRTTDYGIDLTLHDFLVRGRRRSESGFNLDVQAKSTTAANLDEGSVKYDLDVRTYETLRHPRAGTPRLLVLLVLPEDEADWLRQTEEELLLRRCAYWLSLQGRPAVANRN